MKVGFSQALHSDRKTETETQPEGFFFEIFIAEEYIETFGYVVKKLLEFEWNWYIN